MHTLDLITATHIASNAIRIARQSGIKPLAAAVLDAAGHPLAVLRDEQASFLRPQIATGKARGCLGMGFGGRELARRAQAMPAFFDAINSLTAGEVIPVAGGVLIRNTEGQMLGAIGISGDTSDNDERCAVQAIDQAGLVADTGDQPTG
ncbi:MULTISPECIES: GlcG/HbpS family heme-binding protein [Pseudomonas]|uniref:GlcG/HbpS family heme-binding protein n=1 Tax=Pseudomonas TaxID=286 RepID=UPI00062B05B7|nr:MULTISPECIES: heme-binding protein [Pseudomonas]KKX70296.1 GlcG protein [Pseudomonas putida]MCK8656450.1 heme-binding protein [Pseudomonas umsongensis]NBB63569.1 heme-binding protein [Pseudomonas sp. ODNR1LW]OMQ40635.1 GlcG protein [Pseudomonas putida]